MPIVTNDDVPDIGVLASLPVEAALEFSHWHWDRLRSEGTVTANTEPANRVSPDSPVAPSRQSGPNEDRLSEAQEKFLRAVMAHPGLPSSGYAKLVKVGTHQAIAIRKYLVQRGFLREHRVNTAGRGRASIVLEPLPAAKAALQTGKD